MSKQSDGLKLTFTHGSLFHFKSDSSRYVICSCDHVKGRLILTICSCDPLKERLTMIFFSFSSLIRATHPDNLQPCLVKERLTLKICSCDHVDLMKSCDKDSRPVCFISILNDTIVQQVNRVIHRGNTHTKHTRVPNGTFGPFVCGALSTAK